MTRRGFERAAMLDELRTADFDVLVIGGGITGVGCALDAATRGLRVALVERDDFASGTSSKSSKMIHGGLRYLQNGDVRLVYEALRERRRLMRNAPHLVEILPFMIPIMTKDSVVSRRIARGLGSAMWMYDLTGGWRIGRFHKRISAAAAAEHFPTTHADRLSSAYLYFDAGADDARLVVTIARTAARRGATVANRCAVVDITTDPDGHADGAIVEADGQRFPVRARVVVNAAGVWTDDVRALEEGTHPDSIRPAKGVHVSIPWSLVRNDIAVIIPVKRDKRSLFLVPWGDRGDGTFTHTYIGTTDTDYDGPLDGPQCTDEDIDYVLDAVNQAVTTTITAADVTGVWAGLRPLVKAPAGAELPAKTADLSRNHDVAVSAHGVVQVSGGKLTTYRKMAEDAIDVALRQLDPPRGRRRSGSTRRVQLLGATGFRPPTSDDPTARHLARRYGTMAAEVKALVAFEPELGRPLADGHPYLRAEVIYAVQHEMATTVGDVLERRTRLHIFDRAAALAAAPDVASLMARELRWSGAEIERQLDHYRQRCAAEEAAARDTVSHPAD